MAAELHAQPTYRLPWYRGRVTGWIATVDHKRIGILYIVTTLFFFLVAGGLAMLMRWQLAVPENEVFSRDAYNQLFTMHGTAMGFLVVVDRKSVVEGTG